MKALITLIAIAITTMVNAQSLQSLDDRNGFKIIKLDDPITKYASELTYMKSFDNDNTTLYKYSPPDKNLYLVFDTRMDEIRLIFNTSTKKLVGILLMKDYPPSNTNHYENALNEASSIRDKFVALFGIWSSKIGENDNSGEVGVMWQGRKVALSAATDYHGLSKGSDNKIAIFNVAYLKSTLESGF